MEYFNIIVVLIVITFLIIFLYKELLKPIAVYLIAIVVLSVFKILSAQDILSGFANEPIAVIILLLIVGNIIQKTKIVDLLFGYIFKRAQTYKGFLARMMLYVSGSSAFFNNTPLVALMIPYVHSWSKKNNISPSKLLIPLSYAAILGGSATLIGTSTNLIINGMAIQNNINTINIFDFSYVGLPMIIIGFIYMYFFGNKLLPNRKDAMTNLEEKTREYLIEACLTEDSHLIGKTIENAGLRNLKGLFLFEIIREKKRISPITANHILRPNDRLIFAGETQNIVDLIQSSKGLSINESQDITMQERTNIIEIVIPYNSSIINKKIRDIDFRKRFDAAVIAVHRNGEKLSGKIGDIVLHAGDVLLLVSGKGFFLHFEETNDFYLITRVDEIHNITKRKRIILMLGLIVSVLLAALEFISFFKALLVLLVIIIIFKIASFSEIKKSIDFNLLAIAGMAMGLGQAMINSGTAQWLAEHILNFVEPLGVIGLLAGIFIITNLFASYMTNIAAISIIFPISITLGYSLIETGQINNILPFILIVAYGAAANFITPIGYLTNIMVYGSGNYSFNDFFKVGLPLVLIHLIVTVSIISYVFL